MTHDYQQQIDTILRNTYTVTSALYRLSLVREYLSAAHNKRQSLESFFSHRQRDVDVEAVLAWGDSVVGPLRQAGVENSAAIKHLGEAVTALPRLTLYLPVLPDQAGVRTLGEWARAEIDDQILLEVYRDAAAAGGCQFIWKGTFYDFSLRRYFAERRETAIEALQSYASK